MGRKANRKRARNNTGGSASQQSRAAKRQCTSSPSSSSSPIAQSPPGMFMATMFTFAATLSSWIPSFSNAEDTEPEVELRALRIPVEPLGGFATTSVTKTWARKNGRFPHSPQNREALLAIGSLCPRHHFQDIRNCNCPVVPKESVFAKYFPKEVYSDFTYYTEQFDDFVKPVQRKVLIDQLKLEHGRKFEKTYPGWEEKEEDWAKDFPQFHERYEAFQLAILRHDFEHRRIPTAVFDLSGKHNPSVFPEGEFTNGYEFSELAKEARDKRDTKNAANPKKKKWCADKAKFEGLSCGKDCPCATGSGENCACMNYPIGRGKLRGYLDKNGTFRVGDGLAPLGSDSGPSPLTAIEGMNIPVVGCTGACGCGDGCRQRLDKGSRFSEIIHVDPVIDLDLRCGEYTPRGEICSLMSGVFVEKREEKNHDKRMFVNGLCSSHTKQTLTADKKKNVFCLAAHQCSPSMMIVDAYLDRIWGLRRPLAITRRAMWAGERKGWNYRNGHNIIDFTCTCGAANCIHKKILQATRSTKKK